MNVVATRSSTNASPHSVPPPERGSERPRLGAGADLRAWDIAAGAAPHDSAWPRTLGAPITSVRQSWCGLGAE